MAGNRSRKGDRSDHRCAYEGCQNEVDPDKDWCFGCSFYICGEHSSNINLPFGGHDVVDHWDFEPEDE